LPEILDEFFVKPHLFLCIVDNNFVYPLSFPFFVCFPAKKENGDEPEEGTRHFMVNIVEPQFNLHSEDANVSYKIPFHFK